MQRINVIKNNFYSAIIAGCSSQLDESHGPGHVLEKDDSFWSSGKSNSIVPEHIVIDLQQEQALNYIEIHPSINGKTTFPNDFRIEYSLDGSNWYILSNEFKFSLEDDAFYSLQTGLTTVRFIRVYITRTIKVGARFFAELGHIRCGIAGAHRVDASSSSSYEHEPEMLLDEDPGKYWETELTTSASRQSIDIDLGYVFPLNCISILTPSEEINGFPEQFYIEISADNNIWTPVVEEKRFRAEPATTYAWDTGISNARYIRIELNTTAIEKDKYGARIAGLGLYAASNENSHTHSIGDITPHASIFQAGIVRLARDGEDTHGSVVQGSDRRLRDATTIFKGVVQLAEDGIAMDGLATQSSDSRLKAATEIKHGIVRLAYDRENTPGSAVQGNDSRLQEATETGFGTVKLCPDGLESEQGVVRGNDSRLRYATNHAPGIVRLADNGQQTQGCAVQGNDRRLKDASRTNAGIVELAEDGEDQPGLAVQGNDRRLKDATTMTRGIVELAEDGEDVPGVAVQGNDRRLKDATTSIKGIVELAENGEDAPGVAIQGNDHRLRDATTSAKGILRFATNGENSPFAAVQGDDRRLKDATEQSMGILRLAADGESSPMAAVQGNDKRLRQATTTYPGIVELAEDGEDSDGLAVQGNDRRLKHATTTTKGIVELAEDGEDAPGVAVQGNDKRLKHSSTDAPGIVQLASSGQSAKGLAIQADDPRLHDAREPLPHDHHYAPVEHDHNSHTGSMAITSGSAVQIQGIVPPSSDGTSIWGRNTSTGSGGAGIAGISLPDENTDTRGYGVIGHGRFTGIRAQSQGYQDGDMKGCGIVSVSRFGAGGVFSSEHDYSLVVDGFGNIGEYDDSFNLIGEGKALKVNGTSEFTGSIHIDAASRDNEFPANIVENFVASDVEYISPGDLLVVSEEGNSTLTRARTPYNRAVIGIVAGNPVLVFDNTREEKQVYPIAISGKALCKVDARQKPVRPGDLIVTSSTPGCGMAGVIDSFEKTGTVIGKALDSLEDGIGLIPVFITHQ